MIPVLALLAALAIPTDLPANAMQAVVVSGSGASVSASAQMFEREKAAWKPVGGVIPVVVGRTGIVPASDKKESDGHTPAGVYPMTLVFGSTAKIDSKMPYKQAVESDIWIDDPASPDYNTWVTAPTKAKSFEKLHRKDVLYELAIVVGYNTSPVVPGKGSAIFLHVWRSATAGTAGCVAMKKDDLLRVVSWLDPEKHPVVSIQR